MKELVKRINAVRDYYRLSGRALAGKIDLKYTTINNYLNGTKDPSAEFLVALKSTFTEVSADWLLAGEGTMLKPSEPAIDELRKQLEEVKTEIAVKEGIINHLTKILESKIGEKDAAVSEKQERKLA